MRRLAIIIREHLDHACTDPIGPETTRPSNSIVTGCHLFMIFSMVAVVIGRRPALVEPLIGGPVGIKHYPVSGIGEGVSRKEPCLPRADNGDAAHLSSPLAGVTADRS